MRYLRNTERVTAAEVTAREALALAQVMYSSPHRDIIYAKERLKQILLRQNKYAEVLELDKTILADFESRDGTGSQVVAARLLELAKCHRRADQPEQAEAAIRRSIDILEHHPHANLELLAYAHMDLIRMIARTNVAEAVAEAERALELLRHSGLTDEDELVRLNLRYISEHKKHRWPVTLVTGSTSSRSRC